MRKLLVFLVIATLCGCEVISEGDRLIPVETSTSGHRTHVLIEYTGFRCVNCPTAAQTAQTLQELYGEQLSVVSLHPASNPFTQGKYDYTCPAADSLYRLMGGDASTPFPTGNIDFKKSDDRWFFDHAEWPAQVSRAMEDTVAPYLHISTQTDSVSRQVTVTALYELAAEYRLTLWLVEDSVLGVQAMPDGEVNMAYYHRHVLRAVTDEQMLTVPETCDLRHCSVLALLIDNLDYHILNAYETKLDYSTGMSALDN